MYCLICKEKIKYEELDKFLLYTIGNVKNGQFYASKKHYAHVKCSIIENNNPTNLISI